MKEINSSILTFNKSMGWKTINHNGYKIWYAGYIYNKAGLESSFISFTKKEIELKSLLNFVKSLNGHFAFVAQTSDSMFGCVDRIGSIPIFYKYSNKTIQFTNKSNLIVKKNTEKFRFDNFNEFAMSGFISGATSLIKDFFQLEAGQFFLIKDRSLLINSYYSFFSKKVLNLDLANYKKRFTELTLDVFSDLKNTLNERPVLIPLSAGKDSRLVASALKQVGYKNVKCFAYGNKKSFESTTSKRVADALNYDWIFYEITRKKQREFLNSETYKGFISESETFSSVPYIQDISAISFLKSSKFLSDETIVINGNTGDFISGGHIPKSLFLQGKSLNSLFKSGWDDFLNKHYSLWRGLRSKQNDIRIKKNLTNLINSRLNKTEISKENIHLYFEFLEILGRQQKYILNMQRSYEFNNLEWRLPLWSNEFMDFWVSVPLNLKENQWLYKTVLEQNNWGKVWKGIEINNDNIPIRKVRYARNIAKLFFSPFQRTHWSKFDKHFFQYFYDLSGNYGLVPYSEIIKDKLGHRNYISFLTKYYLYSLDKKSKAIFSD